MVGGSKAKMDARPTGTFLYRHLVAQGIHGAGKVDCHIGSGVDRLGIDIEHLALARIVRHERGKCA